MWSYLGFLRVNRLLDHCSLGRLINVDLNIFIYIVFLIRTLISVVDLGTRNWRSVCFLGMIVRVHIYIYTVYTTYIQALCALPVCSSVKMELIPKNTQQKPLKRNYLMPCVFPLIN